MPRYFSLSEANDALRIIRPCMDEIQVIRQEVLAHQPEIWSVMERSAGNGGSATLSRLVQSFDRFDALVHQIQDLGVLIKDINVGLLDFPALRGDREVYLCWMHGEGDIAFWHAIEDGFAGRQPIATF
jgi:hypothetical protein